jgi:hypothetical protein
MQKKLCVYCSSSDRLDPKYTEAATAIGPEMVRRGWDLVYGGGNVGLMGTLARAVNTAGGRVIGVIPEFMKAKELAYAEAHEMHTVVTMRERKLMMESKADAFLALPGGWGTLEEIMEILTLRQLDVLRKPCVFFNQDGFYDELFRFFDRMIAERFNKPSNLKLFSAAKTMEDIFDQLENGAVAAETKWFVTK